MSSGIKAVRCYHRRRTVGDVDPGAKTFSMAGDAGARAGLQAADTPGADAPTSRLRPGDRVGRFLIERCIDQGGMGIVYEAIDEALTRRVALKLLLPDAAERESAPAARLLREARAVAALSHPNVVAVYDVGIHEGSLDMAMELVVGATLRDWLAAAPRTWRDIRDIFVQVGRGLAAAHAVGLVHRDVKPAHILVGKQRQMRPQPLRRELVARRKSDEGGVERKHSGGR